MFKKEIGAVLLIGSLIIGIFWGMGASALADPVLPDPFTLEAYRGRNQETFSFLVTGMSYGPVWGTDIYTDDSWLATAAIHAGVLQPDQEGVVTVMILPGLDRYEGTTRYGVESHSWDEWDGSFQILGVETSSDAPGLTEEKTTRETETGVPQKAGEENGSDSEGIGTLLTAESQLTLAEQQVLAGQLFAQAADMDMWELEELEVLYIRVITEAPDTAQAEEAIWYLGNLYLRAFDPPRYHSAIQVFEHSLARYPGSLRLDEKFPLFSDPGLSLVINRLLFLYEETDNWDGAADLFAQLIPDPSHPGPGQLEHLAYYGRVMEEAGRTEEAIIAYQTFLREEGDPGSFWEDYARYQLEDLGAEIPKPGHDF